MRSTSPCRLQFSHEHYIITFTRNLAEYKFKVKAKSITGVLKEATKKLKFYTRIEREFMEIIKIEKQQ